MSAFQAFYWGGERVMGSGQIAAKYSDLLPVTGY